MGKWARYRKIGTGRFPAESAVLLQEGSPTHSAEVAFTNGFPQLAGAFTAIANETVQRIDAYLRRDVAFDPQVAASLWTNNGGTQLPMTLIVESALSGTGIVPTIPIGLVSPVQFLVVDTPLSVGVTYWVVIRSVPTPAAGQLFWGHDIVASRLARGNGIGGWFLQDANSRQAYELYGTVP